MNTCTLENWKNTNMDKIISEVCSIKARKKMQINLSLRERKVLEYAAQGFDNPQIGKKMYISRHTVKAHMASVLRKLSASNRTNAVYLAIKNHIIE